MGNEFNVMVLFCLCVSTCKWSLVTSCSVSGGVIDLSATNIQGQINSSVFDACNVSHGNVQEIDLSRNSITDVDTSTFVTFYNVQKINMSRNGITDLSNDTFTSLTKLEELDISYNSLTKIKAGLFDLFHLRSVNLQNNIISDVEPGTVSDKNENLLYMNLNNNSLTTFEPWPYLTKLTGDRYIDRIFDIQYNNISRITNSMNWTHDLKWPFQVIVNLQYNAIDIVDTSVISQFTQETDVNDLLSIFLSMKINATHNPYFCDCRLYSFAGAVQTSVLRYTDIEENRYRCSEPFHLDTFDWFHEVYLSELVCNRTIDCPSGCFCQDRPHNDTFYINCVGARLTKMPENIPVHNRSKIEIFLDDNLIQTISDVTYINQIYNLSLSNNMIDSLNESIIKALSSVSHMDLRNNRIALLPREIQRFSYKNVELQGNPLHCDCNSMWISEWMQLSVDEGDTTITCSSDEGEHTLIDLSLKDLDCSHDDVIILGVCLALVLVAGIAIFAFSRICPYETKVILHKLFNCHPSDKYEVDTDDDKEVDIYLIFDWKDDDAVGWIRCFTEKLNRKKPHYSILNPCRFTEGGTEVDNRTKWIGKSRRIIILLSEHLMERQFEMVEDAENYLTEVQAQQHLQSVDVHENNENNENNENDEQNDLDSIDEKVNTAAKIIYIIHNKESARLIQTLETEPWKSRLKDKTVLTCGQRMFWSKLRYELPAVGRSECEDGNFIPPSRQGGRVRNMNNIHPNRNMNNIHPNRNIHGQIGNVQDANVQEVNKRQRLKDRNTVDNGLQQRNQNFTNTRLKMVQPVGSLHKNKPARDLATVLRLEDQLDAVMPSRAVVNNATTIGHASRENLTGRVALPIVLNIGESEDFEASASGFSVI